ncbi:restriction endonuclease [Methanobacterium paludis]|uniref:restriction endonuclease n=1 Tax=Methanobacterium paludis (strain DSM 25820 / JCM 18151 / SWAN1) TaxID=868131 RepID=UPI001D12A1F4|nr:restriction endonuclease [Methanobacterium paludis]
MIKLEKNRLVGFVAKVMEKSGFKVYKNFKTSRHIIDIYGVLPTVLGDMGVVVACKNYDEKWEVGLDVLKEMEMIGKPLKASKIVVVSTSYFTDSAANYAGRRNIKLIDKDGIVALAKKFAEEVEVVEEAEDTVENDDFEDYAPSSRSNATTFLKGKKSLSKGKSGKTILKAVKPRIKMLLNNTLALIVIVLLLSSFATYLIGFGNKNTALLGVSKIFVSAILAYGLVLGIEKDATVVLVKGTTVFFVSMVIYAVMIVIL